MVTDEGRRRLLKALAIPSLLSPPPPTPRADVRYLNLYMYGPFAFLERKGEEPSLTLLCPELCGHVPPFFTTSLSEIVAGSWDMRFEGLARSEGEPVSTSSTCTTL